jgi:hypothetical protein
MGIISFEFEILVIPLVFTFKIETREGWKWGKQKLV